MTEEQLPISVIVPLSNSRKRFFYDYVLPSIKANDPAEIIIKDEEGSAPYKRNKGAEEATQKYLYFCDDDCILSAMCLQTLYDILKADKLGRKFSYCDYHSIVTDKKAHPAGENFVNKGRSFSYEALKKGNYIDTMSLVEKEVFPGFDEELTRFQDWDLWLRIGKEGHKGAYYPDILFLKFYMDQGITSRMSTNEAIKIIKEKHGI